MILPGYTHFQRAQPVLAPHYWLAYCEKFERDRQRLADCRRRANVLPLGAAALAGTSLPIDRDDVAARLGFDGVAANSLDAVSDRDFAVEFAFALTLIAEHLSTWAEEWILWSTDRVQFPETAAGVLHRLVDHAAEDQSRRAGVDPRQDGPGDRQSANAAGVDQRVCRWPTTAICRKTSRRCSIRSTRSTPRLELAAPLVAGTKLNREAIAERLDRGHLDATTLMEYLIRRGVPQRTAHGMVGRLVRKALDRGVRLSDLSLDEFREAHPDLDASVYDVLGPEKAVAAMASFGSTGPST